MSLPEPICKSCGSYYTLRDGCDPTDYCDDCTHRMLNYRDREIAKLRKVLTDLLPFVLEDYFGDCATPAFKAAVEAAKEAVK